MHECTRSGQEETALRDGAVRPKAWRGVAWIDLTGKEHQESGDERDRPRRRQIRRGISTLQR